MSIATLSEQIEQWARRFSLPDECPVEHAEIGAWLIRPPQHVAEMALVVPLFSLILWFSARRFRAQLDRERATEAARPQSAIAAPAPVAPWVGVVDRLCSWLLTISLMTVVWHKFNGAKMAYLLQPCHVLHALLLFIVQLPRGSRLGAVLLSIYLHSLTGPLLGTVGVDLSCYTQPLEAVNWGVQHISLLVVPLHLLASRRFGSRTHSGLAIYTLSFAAMVLFHFAALSPISIVTGVNLNYMLCPPQGVAALVQMGKFYRGPTLIFCAVVAFVLRYICIEAFLATCVNGRDDGQPDDKQTAAAVAPLDSDDDKVDSAKGQHVNQAATATGTTPRREGLRQRL